jgi:histidine triad (HIT) family protein
MPAMRLARFPPARALVGQVFAHMSFALPVHRLRETATLLAFHHPQPAYPLHILLVPKKALASLAALTPADAQFMLDLFSTVQSLVAEFGLEHTGYRLITNGGPYQAVPQLHFHLISDSAAQPPPREP